MDKRSYVKNKAGDIIGIAVETAKDTFVIPVVDVRVNRAAVEAFEKRTNKASKFFAPSYSILGYKY